MFHAFVPGHADANVGTALRISDGSLAIGSGRIQALTIVSDSVQVSLVLFKHHVLYCCLLYGVVA